MRTKVFVLIVLFLPALSVEGTGQSGESFEGIVSFGGKIYPIEDQIGGGASRFC